MWCNHVTTLLPHFTSSRRPSTVNCSPSHFCRVRVTSPSSQLTFLRVESEASHDLVESSQRRVTRTVESFRVIGVQARVNVESNEILHLSMAFSCYKMAPDETENGAEHATERRPIS